MKSEIVEMIECLKDKLDIKIKIRREDDFLEIRVELYLDDKLICDSEDSVNIKFS